MHELSFATQIVESIQRETSAYPDCRITRIKLRAGTALALDPASLRFSIEAISAGTSLEGARVEMEETGPEIDCPACGRVSLQTPAASVCPACGQPGELVLDSGLTIEEIELDDEDAQA